MQIDIYGWEEGESMPEGQTSPEEIEKLMDEGKADIKKQVEDKKLVEMEDALRDELSEKDTKLSDEHKKKISETLKKTHADRIEKKNAETLKEIENQLLKKMKEEEIATHITVKVFNDSRNKLPSYATEGSAGLDLLASKRAVVNGGCCVLIMTGLFVEIPKGYELQIRPKSGLAVNHMLTVLNSPGTIDSDYRGEIGVLVINHNQTHKYIIEVGDKVAQAVLSKVETISWQNVESQEDLEETIRSDGGYGSTGK